jgi:hypothetical protein
LGGAVCERIAALDRRRSDRNAIHTVAFELAKPDGVRRDTVELSSSSTLLGAAGVARARARAELQREIDRLDDAATAAALRNLPYHRALLEA